MMRFTDRLALGVATFTSFLLTANVALADAPDPVELPAPGPPTSPDSTDPPPPPPSSAALPPSSPPSADTPAGPPSSAADPRRAEGMRLGLDLGFQRAFDGAPDRLHEGTPTLLPLGLDLSFRTSPTLLFGLHGYAALASRDDCIEQDSCRARAYGFGGHVETSLGRGTTFVPWFRYGVGYEILYQGGAPLDPAGHVNRGAIDLLDARLGVDYVAAGSTSAKSTRIGAFAGLVGGILVTQSGVTSLRTGRSSNLDSGGGSAHLWFVMGVRATLDP